MTRDDFQAWLQHHGSCFFGLEGAISKACLGQNAPTRAQVLGRWFHTLASVDLEDAKEASNLMHRGEIEEPKGFDRHPAAIRAAAQRLARRRGVGTTVARPRYVNGEETFACLLCHDYGVRFVWNPKTYEAVKQGKLGTSAGVACTCTAGDRVAKQYGRFSPADYLEFTNRLCEVDEPEEQRRLLDWLETRKPANHEHAFDAFGG